MDGDPRGRPDDCDPSSDGIPLPRHGRILGGDTALDGPKNLLSGFFVTVGVGALLGILFYAPIWSTAVLPHFVSVFSGASMPAGSFPPPAFFFLHQGILLFFGLGGFVISFQRERGTLWQWAVLWSGVFVVMHFFFYRRFFLHLDFSWCRLRRGDSSSCGRCIDRHSRMF